MKAADPRAPGGPLYEAAMAVDRKLAFVRPDKPTEIIPDFGARHDATAEQVVASLATPAEEFFTLPWAGLDRLVGTLRPASVIVVAAYTGLGKTTWGLNAVSRFVDRDQRVYVIVAEEEASDYLERLAAVRLHLPIVPVMTNRWDRLPDGSAAAILDEVQNLREQVIFAPSREISPQAIKRGFAEARQAECACVVVDHIHHGDRRYDATVSRMYALRDCVLQEQLPVIALAQMRRDEGFVLAGHVAPRLSEIEGGEVIAQCADLVLGLYWPLRSDANRAKLMKRQMDIRDALVTGQINVRCMKHRLDGSRRHREAILYFDVGRLSDPPETAQVEAEV